MVIRETSVRITPIWRPFAGTVTARMISRYGPSGATRPGPGAKIAAGRYWANRETMRQ